MVLLSSPAVPANPSPQLRAVLGFGKALGECDVNAIGETITDDYIHYNLPESLGSPHLEGKEAFSGFFGKVLTQFVAFDILIKEIIEAPGKVVLHATGGGKTKTGLELKGEYIVIIDIKEQPDGSFKIHAMKEFADSKLTSTFMAALFGGVRPT